MKLYSIGEVSKLNNITIKTLRYYDKVGLLEPAYIDEANGYRYYSYNQFLIIDKIKKFKYWDIPLNELKEILYNEDESKLKEFFVNQRTHLDLETKKIEKLKNNLNILEEHFNYFDIVKMNKNVYVRNIKKRHYISSHCYDKNNVEDVMEADMELRKILSSAKFSEISMLNPYGYILDTEQFMNDKLILEKSTVTIGQVPNFETEHLFTAPEGTYVCFSTKILSGEFDLKPLINYVKEQGIEPKLILAEEFIPNGIYEFINCPYEIQILIS